MNRLERDIPAAGPSANRPLNITAARLIRWRKRLWQLIAGLLLLLLAAYLLYFPGQQSFLAFSLATGLGISPIQQRIDALEEKAIARAEFSPADKAFLRNLYACMAKGARLIGALRQSGQMMDHYLGCTGEPLQTEPRIFTANDRVMEQAEFLRQRFLKDRLSPRGPQEQYATETFYMPHSSSPDSVFGLYYGRLILRPRMEAGQMILCWRAEVPWQWPAYESLLSRYGNYHAECFPLPNLRTIISGPAHALKIDNGLGEYLAQLGLAKPFVVYAQWEEPPGQSTSNKTHK